MYLRCVLLCVFDVVYYLSCVFVFKQKTAYEMRISDWSSDVCSSDLWVCLRSPSLEQFKSPREVIRLPVMQLEKAIGLFDNLRLDHRCDVDFRKGVQPQIGRASCRERVCQYVSISVVAESLKKKKTQSNDTVN